MDHANHGAKPVDIFKEPGTIIADLCGPVLELQNLWAELKLSYHSEDAISLNRTHIDLRSNETYLVFTPNLRHINQPSIHPAYVA